MLCYWRCYRCVYILFFRSQSLCFRSFRNVFFVTVVGWAFLDSGHPYAFQEALLGLLGAVYALYAAVVDDGHCFTSPYRQLVFHWKF